MRRFYTGLCSGLFALALLVGVSTTQKAEAAVTFIETDTFNYAQSFSFRTLSFSIPVTGLYEFSYGLISGSGFTDIALQVFADDAPVFPDGFTVGSATTDSFQAALLAPGDYTLAFFGSGATESGQYALTAELITAVPESSTWAMMIAGLGLLGWRANAVRRRQRLNAQALAA